MHTEAVAGRLKECEYAKDVAHGLILIIGIERDNRNKFVWSLNYRVKKLLVGKGPSGSDVVALDVKWDSSMAAREVELDGFLVTVGAKLDFVDLP